GLAFAASVRGAGAAAAGSGCDGRHHRLTCGDGRAGGIVSGGGHAGSHEFLRRTDHGRHDVRTARPAPGIGRRRARRRRGSGGLLLADGRKVTTLDAAPWPTAGRSGPTLRLSGGSGGAFHYQMGLHLSQLPPTGPTRLVVEWPDEQVPETATDIDATALRQLA